MNYEDDDEEEDSTRLKLGYDDDDCEKSSKKESRNEFKSKLKDIKIGIIGAGKLAYAIVCGIINYTDIVSTNIFVSAKTDKNLIKFKEKGCEVTQRNYDIFARFDCDIVFLCFHSSVIKQCYRIGYPNKPIPFTIDYIPVPNHRLNILSLVSGITSGQIIECLIDVKQLDDFELAIHRIVLNVGVAYGWKSGIGAIDYPPEKCDPIVEELLSSISTLEEVSVLEMDNLCAFSTTGLVLSHCFSSGLVGAAFNLGFDSLSYHKMPAYAMLSAAVSVLQSKKSPLDLLEEWTSISSISMPGIQLLKDFKFDMILETAFDAICKRIEVSKDSKLSLK